MREHATSVHLMLDPADASELHVDARQHPELPDPSMSTWTACAATSPSAAPLNRCWPWSSACGPSWSPLWLPLAAATSSGPPQPRPPAASTAEASGPGSHRKGEHPARIPASRRR